MTLKGRVAKFLIPISKNGSKEFEINICDQSKQINLKILNLTYSKSLFFTKPT